MKKFEFKLQSLLKLREIEEQHKLAELAGVVSRYQENIAAMEKFKSESKHLLNRESQRLQQEQTLDFDYMRSVSRYLGMLRMKRNSAEKNLEGIAGELAKKQEEVAKYRTRRRAIEILKEKRIAEHKYEANREQQNQLDEFNSNRKPL